MTTVAHQAKKGYRTLRLPLAEHEYDLFVSDKTFAKERLAHLYGQYPELFPEAFDHGGLPSKPGHVAIDRVL
jgi:hypothetical protein